MVSQSVAAGLFRREAVSSLSFALAFERQNFIGVDDGHRDFFSGYALVHSLLANDLIGLVFRDAALLAQDVLRLGNLAHAGQFGFQLHDAFFCFLMVPPSSRASTSAESKPNERIGEATVALAPIRSTASMMVGFSYAMTAMTGGASSLAHHAKSVSRMSGDSAMKTRSTPSGSVGKGGQNACT